MMIDPKLVYFNMEEFDGWVQDVELHEEGHNHAHRLLTGNRAGLLEIKSMIDEALENGSEVSTSHLEINKIVFEDSPSPEGSHDHEDVSKVKEAFMTVSFGLWFMILPLIGIAALIYFLIKLL